LLGACRAAYRAHRDRPPAPRARSLASVFHRGARAVAPRGQRAAGSHFV